MRTRTLLLVSLLLALALCASAQPAPRDDRAPALKESRIQGTVESLHGEEATVRTPEGWKVNVHLGPQTFWRDHGYRLEPGMRVNVRGWRRGDDVNGPFFAGTIWGPHFRFTLTNERGFPIWADRDDYRTGWYPTWDDFYYYYWGPYGPDYWTYGPPPPPPPPPFWWHHRHPDWRWRGYGHGSYWDRGPGGRGHGDRNHDRDYRDRDDRDNRDNHNGQGNDNNNNPPRRRSGRHGG
jgi:hypothetical protein